MMLNSFLSAVLWLHLVTINDELHVHLQHVLFHS